MRIIITTLGFSLLFSLATLQAQDDKNNKLGIVEDSVRYFFDEDIIIIQKDSAEINKDLNFDEVLFVEQIPLFKGGDPAIEFRKFIAMNFRYPEEAAENHITGRVLVQFIINSEGRLVDAVVIASVHPLLDEEALRVINSSPLWTPGKQGGKPVKAIMYCPINFSF